jgi:hypothetical protein
MQDLERKN